MRDQRGYIEEFGALAIVMLFIALLSLAIFTKTEWSEDNVSGIVYNTTNNNAFSGNTRFSIRAGENTPVTPENESSYCLPPSSPYKELVNRAAGDKRIKVQVTTKKGFWIRAPWTCVNNVTVTEVR